LSLKDVLGDGRGKRLLGDVELLDVPKQSDVRLLGVLRQNMSLIHTRN